MQWYFLVSLLLLRQFLGVAVREVKSAVDYLNQNEGKYAPGQAVPDMKLAA